MFKISLLPVFAHLNTLPDTSHTSRLTNLTDLSHMSFWGKKERLLKKKFKNQIYAASVDTGGDGTLPIGANDT